MPPRAFDAADLGQGRKLGGGVLYQRARLSLWRRVVRLFPDLPEDARENVDRTWRLWDVAGTRRLGPAWGHAYRGEMLKLKRCAETGDRGALVQCVRALRRMVPEAEITV